MQHQVSHSEIVTDVRTRLLQLPFTDDLRTTYGNRSACTILLVSVETADGTVGHGESVGLFQETAAAFIDHEIKPLVLNEDCRRVERILDKVEHLIGWNSFAAYPIAALDMALHDAKGKHLGVPVYELLGGCYRTDIRFSGLIHIHSPEEDAARTKALVERGYTHVKVKVALDLDLDLRRLARIRDVCGDAVSIRIDPNMAWSPRTAVRMIEQMSQFDLEYVEQPVPGWDMKGLADVARSISVPICADESCQSPRDALALAELQACEAFLVYLSEAGGLLRAKEIAAIAQAAGIHCGLGTWGEGGVGFAAGLHLATACRTMTLVSDTAYDILDGDYVTEPFALLDQGGSVATSPAPGLGVEPDLAKVDELRPRVEDRVFREAAGGVPRLRQFVGPLVRAE